MKNIFRAFKITRSLFFLFLRSIFDTHKGVGPTVATPRKILILGYTAIGDAIFLLPALRALRLAFPQAAITFVANHYPTAEELIPAMNIVNDIWFVELSASELENKETARKIKNAGFDLVILSQSTPARFIASALLSIPIRVGHCRRFSAPREGWSFLRYALWKLKRAIIAEEFERRIVLNKKVWVSDNGEHMVSQNLRLIQSLGIPVPSVEDSRPEIPDSLQAQNESRVVFSMIQEKKKIGLHIGAPQSQYFKIWAPEKWGEVCRNLKISYDVEIVLFGSGHEKEMALKFKESLRGACTDLVGKLTLLGTFSAMRRCDLFLSSDTGLAKAAMAMNVPTATVWGPSDRPGFGIIWNPKIHIEIFNPIPCAPCVNLGFRREGPGVINYDICGHHRCLAELSWETVLKTIRNYYRESLLSS